MMGSYTEIEDRILEACEAAKRVEKPNISALSREFSVPYGRLRARLLGRGTRTSRPAPTKALDDLQEKALIRWIRQLDVLHSPPTPTRIEVAANDIRQRNADTETRKVGKTWVYRFINRLPKDFELVKQKPQDQTQLNSENLRILQHWFDLLEPCIARIPPRNIYNFDETGFQLGQGKSQTVVTTRPHLAVQSRASKKIGEPVSAIECIAADGSNLPPYFIFKGTDHTEQWYDSDMPGDYRIALSPKGYTTDAIGLDWIHHFEHHTRPRLVAKDEPRLLLFDGHRSHPTYAFLRFCGQHKIIPYCFYPHTTHLIQPLDGQPFQEYKHYYQKRNSDLAELGVETEDKAAFLKEIPGIRKNAFKARTIRDSFKKRGIYPFNPEAVIGPLRKATSPMPELENSSTPPPNSSISPLNSSVSPPNSSVSPPSPIRELRQSIQKAEDYIQDNPQLNSSFVRRLDRVFKSALKSAELVSQLEQDLQLHLQLQKPQCVKKSLKRLRESGPSDVQDANRHVQSRNDEERPRNNPGMKRQRGLRHRKSTIQADGDTIPSQEGGWVDNEGCDQLFV